MPIQATPGQTWVIETSGSGYAFGRAASGHIEHLYWGPKLPALADYPLPAPLASDSSFSPPTHLLPLEYPVYGDFAYSEPCLKATFADGVRGVSLAFLEAELHDEQARVHLADLVYPLRVTLHYRASPAFDLIARWVTITNDGPTSILLERAWSAQWHLPRESAYRLTHLTGSHMREFQLVRESLTRGTKVLESRRLTTSHQHQPWFAVDRGQADESNGEVWFGTLAWSGNWKLAAEVTDFDATRLSLGVNDWDFAWRLEPGATFTTPISYAGYTTEGFGGASRRLHAFIRMNLLPHPATPRKVLYNSWEATWFTVDEASQMQLAERAAAIGVEQFVLDDGWFHGRFDDTAGLGDWWPDEHKFPQGLGPLIGRVNALGMDFGLWIEPEMVNPDSDLYRAHPDWVLHFSTRPRSQARNQLILNLARQDVQEYLIARLDALLSQYAIAFVKWDMNRNVSEPGWSEAPGDPREVWVRSVEGLYRVWDTLCARHPQVLWQSCSGGGGRADLAILQRADQIWVSDTTEATSRLAIQEGFSQVFPACTMESWVTDVMQDHLPLSFRFHVSMCGVLGIGGHLLRWSPEERAEAAHWIARYKALRPLIQFGDQFRLLSAQDQATCALTYLSPDRTEGVLFAFRLWLPLLEAMPEIRLQGLNPLALYVIEGVDGVRTGTAWMEEGLHLSLANFSSTMRQIRQVVNEHGNENRS